MFNLPQTASFDWLDERICVFMALPFPLAASSNWVAAVSYLLDGRLYFTSYFYHCWMNACVSTTIPLAACFLLFMCMCIYVPLSRPASSNWLDGRQCVCAFPLPRPHPFSRCINVCVYPFLWLFSLTSLMNVCVFNFASFLAFSYSLYCRLCFTPFSLLPLAHRLIDWMNVCVCVCVASNSLD